MNPRISKLLQVGENTRNVHKKHCSEWNCALTLSVQRPQCQDFHVFKTVSSPSIFDGVNSVFFFLHTLVFNTSRLRWKNSADFKQNISSKLVWRTLESTGNVLPVWSYSVIVTHTHDFKWLSLSLSYRERDVATSIAPC